MMFTFQRDGSQTLEQTILDLQHDKEPTYPLQRFTHTSTGQEKDPQIFVSCGNAVKAGEGSFFPME